MILGATQRLYSLAVARARFIDVSGNGRRTNERDRLDQRMRKQRVDGFLVAVNDIENSIRQAGLLEQFGHACRKRRVAFGGFEYKGVAAGDGHRKHPQRHHRGEIERRNARAYADGLAADEKLSTSVPTFSLNSPLSRCGMPVANSITSMPRVTSPSASANVLPCSCVMIAASSFRRVFMSSRKRIRIRARRNGGNARQAGNAAAAASTAAPTSAALARGTCRTTSPVAGLVISANRVDCAATCLAVDPMR